MIIYNATLAQLEEAAKAVDVELYNVRDMAKKKGTTHRLRILPRRTTDDKGRRLEVPWTRLSTRYAAGQDVPKRRIRATCFHGHWAFFRALFELVPGMKIMTSKATWDSPRSLEYGARDVGSTNIGSMMFPVCLEDACVCTDENIERARTFVIPTVRKIRVRVETLTFAEKSNRVKNKTR